MTSLCQSAACLRPTADARTARAETGNKHRGFIAGLFRHFFDAIWEAHQRQALRDIDRIVVSRAGLINDALEREMSERLLRGEWNTRA
jgi:hypothetical protein